MPCTLILFWCFDVCILEKQIRFFDTSWWLYPHCIISIWHSPGILHNTKHEFPLFIWTIHSTVLKLQITHRPGWPGPRAPGCPRCPRVWFAQSLVPAHCRGQGPSLAPGPGMSRSQWISHHIPRRQFSFRTHDPKDKQYLSNVFFNRGIGLTETSRRKIFGWRFIKSVLPHWSPEPQLNMSLTLPPGEIFHR